MRRQRGRATATAATNVGAQRLHRHPKTTPPLATVWVYSSQVLLRRHKYHHHRRRGHELLDVIVQKPKARSIAMSFGWSATDVVAALTFIVDAAQALDDSEGAGKDFRQASAFLHHLDQALKPLQTFEALDATPEYKAQIETQVAAIRGPIEVFMKDVEGMARQLGAPSQGRFRRFKNVHRKWEWHYFTSKKAIALQKDIERHLNILDTLMQQLLLYVTLILLKTGNTSDSTAQGHGR